MTQRAPLVAAGLFMAAAFVTGCGESTPTSPTSTALVSSLSSTTESEHYVFRHTPGSWVDAVRQERFHVWWVALFGIDGPSRITFYRYRDRQHLESLTGQASNGYAVPESATVHSIYPWDAHEAIHVLSLPLGRPTDFWNEGIAVAYTVNPADGALDAVWHSRSVHAWALEFALQRRLPALTDMVETAAFRRLDQAVGYPVAGSFVAYLGATHGIGCLVGQFRGAGRDDSRTVASMRFRAACGRTLDDADREWRDWLRVPPS